MKSGTRRAMVSAVFLVWGAFLCLVTLRAAPTAAATPEAWADANLPVKQGLTLWLDASHQPAARAALGKPELAPGDAIETCYDASGHRRHFAQPQADAQPSYHVGPTGAALDFDGRDDHLLWSAGGEQKPIDPFTAILIVAPRSNRGEFRGFLAAHQTGRNDYVTGFTIDMGPFPSSEADGFAVLNVEGSGFGMAQNLMRASVAFDELSAVTVTCAGGEKGVRAYLNNAAMGTRDRDEAATVSTQNFVLGARFYSNEAVPPHARGHLDGRIAEVIVYDRVLSDDERAALHAYLVKKYPGLPERQEIIASDDAAGDEGHAVPEVQVFVPGFTARRLPLELSNVNNLRYRHDGKLVALAYDGNVYLLSDSDGDGLEDQATLFWDNKGRITSPIGMALTPPDYAHGQGLFVAGKGKLSLITDTTGDDRADTETIVAEGWRGTFHQVDALGVALAEDGSVYFGVGTSNFADPYLVDKRGKSHYDLANERGTILRVAPDLKSRQIVCTGIRFPVGMAFNRFGDLFCTDQEGATWVPNGNPLDELLHVQSGRHYGFPARHPRHLPSVVDEPSTFDYAPQHQSTCGLLFNEPVNGGPVFGPESWRGDAIVCGASRGKIYRTRLAQTPAGYVAQNFLIASIPMIVVDAAVSPQGDLIVAAHSGNPDWGSGPTGKGALYKISYRGKGRKLPQAALVWPAGEQEVRIAFDRPLDAKQAESIVKEIAIESGAHVAAGDYFEKIRPGYAIVRRQARAPREQVAVSAARLSEDRRTLILSTAPGMQVKAVGYAVTLSGFGRSDAADEIEQVDRIDLAYDLTGLIASWGPASGEARGWSGWLPHADLDVARAFTAGSAQHEALWPLLRTNGKLTLKTSLELSNLLRPAVQPGSQLDFVPPPEKVTLTFHSNLPVRLRGVEGTSLTLTPKEGELIPLELELDTGADVEPNLTVTFTTADDPHQTPRPLALRRFLLPWARLQPPETIINTFDDVAELRGGDWLRGRELFFGNHAGCSKCHTVNGHGSDLGPDLSNLIHRDYESVMRDLRNPSGALNPDYVSSIVKLRDGRVLSGIVRPASPEDPEHVFVRGDADGEKAPIPRSAIARMVPSSLSMMPEGLPEALGTEATRDLLTFLLTRPLEPAPLERDGAPPPRPREQLDAILAASGAAKDATKTQGAPNTEDVKPLNVLLVTGPKDHGPGEHDYPLWQRRWKTLLSLADDVTVTTARPWPTPEQWSAADVAVFYSNNPGWSAERGAELDRHLARGGGLIYLHYAVDGHDAPEALADRIGLAWRGGRSKFRHGEVDLAIRDRVHPITRGFPSTVRFTDESYWQLVGDPAQIDLLADGVEDGQPQPLLWTRQHERGRVFVCILGHYNWTFDDPLFRLLLLRAICWTADEANVDRLSHLATIGARVQP